MRVGKSSSLSGFVGEMGPSAGPSQAVESVESNSTAPTSFAEELNSAGKESQSAVQGSQQPAAKTEQTESGSAPVSEPTGQADLPVVDGLIALAATKSGAVGTTGSAATSGSDAPPPKPLCSTNQVFNLVTTSASSTMAAECRSTVDAALRDIGLDPEQYKMSFWEEMVGYPGGGYMNRCITVETPEGYRMDFDAAATLRSPRVTAAGIQLLKSGYWNATAAAS